MSEATKKTVNIDEMNSSELIEHFGGVSKAIRGLDKYLRSQKVDEKKIRGTIAKKLNKRYQHVRQVLITPIGS